MNEEGKDVLRQREKENTNAGGAYEWYDNWCNRERNEAERSVREEN